MLSRSLFFICIMVPLIIIGAPLQMIIVGLNLPCWHFLPRLFHKMACVFMGLKVTVIGTPVRNKPVLLVSNHISWNDIIVLGSVADVSFVAKSDVGKWFFVSYMAGLQKTIYVDYNRKRDARRTSQEMAKRLADNSALVLFAEGHRDIGTHVRPFRSALIGAAQNAMLNAGAKDVVIQPVTIAYTKLQGLPVSFNERSYVSGRTARSFKEMVKDLLSGGVKQVTIAFGNPIEISETTDRKQLAAETEEKVRRVLVRLNRGRELPADL